MPTVLQKQKQSDLEIYKTNVQKKIESSLPNIVEAMCKQWVLSMELFWQYDPKITVQERFDALGTKGGEVFAYNTSFVTFLLTNLTGKRDDLVSLINSKMQLIKPCTINEDGTVTILEEPQSQL